MPVLHDLHPTKVSILEAVSWIGRPLSTDDLEQILGEQASPAALAYHLGSLVTMGLVEEPGRQLGNP